MTDKKHVSSINDYDGLITMDNEDNILRILDDELIKEANDPENKTVSQLVNNEIKLLVNSVSLSFQGNISAMRVVRLESNHLRTLLILREQLKSDLKNVQIEKTLLLTMLTALLYQIIENDEASLASRIVALINIGVVGLYILMNSLTEFQKLWKYFKLLVIKIPDQISIMSLDKIPDLVVNKRTTINSCCRAKIIDRSS